VTVEPVWAPVVAALGASFLTGVLVLARDIRHDHREDRRSLSAARAKAYGQMMTVSGLLVHTAGTMHSAMETRTGLGAGLNVALRITKPVDTFQLDEFLRRDTVPLYEALSGVWIHGTHEAIRAANEVASRSTDVIGSATVHGAARSRLARYFAGERWTQTQLDDWQRAIERLAVARADLANIARHELGLRAAAFLGNDTTVQGIA